MVVHRLPSVAFVSETFAANNERTKAED